MRFKITLTTDSKNLTIIPINYQYPLSAALYRIIAKGDAEYANFLHETGYGKGFKLFTFSQINCSFDRRDDRFHLKSNELWFEIAFHFPEALESFVKGLFMSESIDIADKKSKATFSVKSIESLPNPLAKYKDNEIVSLKLKPLSPVVVGLKNDRGHYDFLEPTDERFAESLIYNWRNKIETCFDPVTGSAALLMLEIIPMKSPAKSRLITIKADTPEETKIRGWLNFELKVTAEKRFVDLLLNAGAGLYNAMGMGCVDIIE